MTPNAHSPAVSALCATCLVLAVAFLTFVVPTPIVRASESSHTSSDYVRTTFKIEDGLPDNTVNTITQTRNGLLWAGTASGLASFDGHTFRNVELRIPGSSPSSAVNALMEDSNGDLWVGSDAGVVRIPASDLNDPFLSAMTAYRLGRAQSDEVQVLLKVADGDILAGTSHGLYRFDGSRFVSLVSSIYVSRIKQLRDGRIMLVTGAGLAEYDAVRGAKLLSVGAQLGVRDSDIYDIYEDSSGKIWYCTQHGIRTIGPNGFIHLEPTQPATARTFRATPDSKGVQWVATGIGLYSIVDGQLIGPSVDTSLRAFYVGKEGDLWIGINGGGLTHLQHRTVHMFTKSDGLANDLVMTVLPAKDGRLWVGNNCGLEVFDGSVFKTFNEKDGLLNSCVWALAEDNSANIWVGTYGGGMFRFHAGVFQQFSMEQGLASRIVNRIVTASDGSLWIATPDGLSHFIEGSINNYTIADGLSSNQVLDVHQAHDGTLWVATQAGVDRLVGNRFISVPSLQTASAVLANRFAEDSNGNLYTTDAPTGISRVIGNRLVYQPTPVALMNMVEASDHSLWFSGHSGIIRFAGGVLTLQDNPGLPLDYQQFGIADGLNSSQASVGGPNLAITGDGKVWVATVGGLAMIDSNRISTVAIKPSIFISDAMVDGSRNRVGDHLMLSPGNHHVELSLAVVDLATPEKVRLQYRLDGVDDAWLEGNATRTVTYTNVPVGSHRLYVRATDSTGHWSREAVVYQIAQQPHFYQSKLFQFAASMVFILLITLAYLVRVNHLLSQTHRILEARQIERETIARDLHDTLFQGVEGGLLLINSVTSRLPMEVEAKDTLREAFQRMNHVMASARGAIFGTTRPVEASSFEDAITLHGKQTGLLSTSTFSMKVSGRKRDVRTVVQEELLKIVKEALNNAFRHADANAIEVRIAYTRHALEVWICDDGVGIDPSILSEGGKPNHWGIPSMQQRAAKIGAHLHIARHEPQGTAVLIKLSGPRAFIPSAPPFSLRGLARRYSKKT